MIVGIAWVNLLIFFALLESESEVLTGWAEYFDS
jgi:hypothetical protein